MSLFREYNGKKLSLKDRIALVEKIGNRSVLASTVLRKLIGVEAALKKPLKQSAKSILPEKTLEGQSQTKEIYIAGEKGLPYKFANCCKPVELHPIVGYVTREQKITIHAAGCKMLRTANQERLLQADWGEPKDSKSYSVKIGIKAKDRVGLIRDMADVISQNDVGILDFKLNERSDDNLLDISMILEIQDNQQLDEVISKLGQVRNALNIAKAD